MRKITRFSEPKVLAVSKEKWLGVYLSRLSQDFSFRPSSSQYAHDHVRQALRTMSHGKCFYCERKLSEKEEEVDHYRDVAEHPEFAFTWENLYLSCEGCNNGKPSDRDIPVEQCVDPCDASDDPSKHLGFDDEQVVGIPGTKGLRTIQKYRLNRQDLAYQRSKALLRFKDELLRMISESAVGMRRTLSPQQILALRVFAQEDMPFSAMFADLLARIPAVSDPTGGTPAPAGSGPPAGATG